jgi:protocatechuate 3,4-dioxygenase beta subunit
VLDEEVQRLPQCFREAFVLCVLEGKSGAEAAIQLSCAKGTVRSRVNRARRLLQGKLACWGIKLTALLAALSVAESAGRASVPPPLLQATVRFGLLVAAGESAAGVIPPHIAALAAGVTPAMILSHAKIPTVLLLTVGLCVVGAWAYQTLAAKESPSLAPKSEPLAKQETGSQASGSKSQAPGAKDQQGGSIEVSGRVVDPEGKPFAGAKVFFARSVLALRDLPPPVPPVVTSDAEGRFRLHVSQTGYQSDDEKSHWLQGAVVAVAQGYGHGWVGGDNAEQLRDVTVKLVKDVPIESRVVDLQGKPVAGVSVQVRSVGFRTDGGDLKEFVEALKQHRFSQPLFRGVSGDEAPKEPFPGPHSPDTTLDPALLGLAQPPMTGADGKFRLTGISGECLVSLRFEGPTIEVVELYALTRPAPAITVPRYQVPYPRLGTWVFHGSVFEHVAAPTRPIEGVVRDKDTGQPLAGVTIKGRIPSALGHRAHDQYLSATTDREGRYRLIGFSTHGPGIFRGSVSGVQAVAAPGQPYLPAVKSLGTSAGLDPVTMDFALKRGVLIRGRVTDKETGRPVVALVKYAAFRNSPHLKEAPGFEHSTYDRVRTAEDGSFTIIGLPGRGLLAARAADGQDARYLVALGADQIQGPRFYDLFFDTKPRLCNPVEFNALAEVNPAQDAESIMRDLVLDSGKSVAGTIVDPDGKPVKGASIDHVQAFNSADSVLELGLHVTDLPTAEFRIPGVDPKHPRWYLFRHSGQKLGAVVQFRGDEPMPVTVRLQKYASITGRLVDAEGRPRSGWVLGLIQAGQLDIKVGGVDFFTASSGSDGRFRIEGVLPGLKIGLWARDQNLSYLDTVVPELRAGEVKDVGDLRMKRP